MYEVTSASAVHRIHRLYDLLGPGGYPRIALSLPIYGLTANDCRWIPLSNGVRKKTEETSRTMQKSSDQSSRLLPEVKRELSSGTVRKEYA